MVITKTKITGILLAILICSAVSLPTGQAQISASTPVVASVALADQDEPTPESENEIVVSNETTMTENSTSISSEAAIIEMPVPSLSSATAIDGFLNSSHTFDDDAIAEDEHAIFMDEELKTSDIATLVDKLSGATPMSGVSDPKWGGISWADHVREENVDGSVIYWLESELNGCQFSIKIFDDTPLGFSQNDGWVAAIVPADYVAYENVSCLCYEQYIISVDSDRVCVVDNNTKESQSRDIKDIARMSDRLMLLTISDGKHAKCVTCRPEFVSFMYALAR